MISSGVKRFFETACLLSKMGPILHQTWSNFRGEGQ